jgi:hypothetical protein
VESESESLLIGLLHEAASLEHCLLNSYLYAACSLKSHPEEFATLSDGRENRRRAIQFERTRAWKQSILHVAHEEMLHLHYVQCMIRALGKEPYLGLPERDPDTGSWHFGGWRARIGGHKHEQGTNVPVEPLTPRNARRFVLYEATDALQDEDPFGPAALDLFGRLHDFELDLLFESALFDVPDASKRKALKAKLEQLYKELLPAEPAAEALQPLAGAPEPIDVGSIQFQSIADLYNKAILPLYQEAFQFGRVPYSNFDLNAELQDPNYAGEGFNLPVGPIYRDKNFEARAQENIKDPLRNYKDVAEIVAEIVAEGEGLQAFQQGAQELLDQVATIGGSRAFLQAVLADQRSPAPTPAWLQAAQRIRYSHLYQFAMTMVEFDAERDLARQAGTEFKPARSPLARGTDPAVDRLSAAAPAQFNACYLALVAWLSRLYEVRTWDSDRRRRMGLEMLAAWPMMSIAIRPFLELVSFLAIDRSRLFRTEDDALPNTPVHARQLLRLYLAPERSQEINDRMDYYALQALSDVARWSAEQRDALAGVDIDPVTKRMILTRLDLLSVLDEFERQYPFREHGGYSARPPDIQYQLEHPDGQRFEETPQDPLFNDTLVLRLRFAGRGLVQLATDPDPPTDEVGCTGGLLLHAADADHWLDRSFVWQPSEVTNAILREPRDQLPPVGVRAAEVALMVTDGKASVSYVPLAVQQSPAGVLTIGVQQRAEVRGLNPIVALAPADVVGSEGSLRVDLLPVDGRMPFLGGYNHLVWQDGAPIDPFVLSVVAETSDGDAPVELLRREVFNEGRTLLEMDPLQRLLSSRAPCGFDFDADVPGWALAMLSQEERELLADPRFPISYLMARANVLGAALQASLANGDPTRASVDEIVSFLERTRLVAIPLPATIGWLTALLNYGHTISGVLASAQSDPLLDALGVRVGARLAASTVQRGESNGRWMVVYSKGIMDADALSDVVYGELYVPLTAQPADGPTSFERTWRFASGMEGVVASYACCFAEPFWTRFHVTGNTRTTTLPNGVTITETLTQQGDADYTYTASGVPGISDYSGRFAVTTAGDATELSWTATFTSADAISLVRMLTINAAAAAKMGSMLTQHFSPSG